MCKYVIAAAILSLGLSPAFAADQPQDPFAKAPADKVSVQTTDRGALVVSNVPGNRYTYELVGKKVERVNHENKDNPHARIWSVDGIALQSVPLPLAPKGDPKGDFGYAEQVLVWHNKFENDHWAKQGYKEVESARAWLTSSTGDPALYWELRAPEKAEKGASKMLFASAVNGRNAILFSASILPGVDEVKACKILRETVLSLKRYEKNVARIVYLGDATMLLLNDELATRNDRKAPGAVAVKPETLMLLLRMSLELAPQPAGHITFVHDGKSGHVITLRSFDREKKRYVYLDTLGNKSFLQEGNNRAGVKAERLADKGWAVAEAELQTVLQGVLSIPCAGVRAYFGTGTLEDAVTEYRILQMRDPKSPELREAFLLRAAQMLAEGKEDARAVNTYAVCRMLHEKSARALAGIAAVYAKIGKTESARNFYADALKGLPDDPALDAKQREKLAAEWEAARKKLAAKSTPGSGS